MYDFVSPLPRMSRFMLRNMCSETRAARIGLRPGYLILSSFVISAGWQVLGGLLTVSVCALTHLYYRLISPTYNLSIVHLRSISPARHCGVSGAGLDYLWGYNGAVRDSEINGTCFCCWEALITLLCCYTCSLSVTPLTPGDMTPSLAITQLSSGTQRFDLIAAQHI